MARYLEAHVNITHLKKKGWHIAQMATQLKQAFPTEGKTCKCIVVDKATKTTLCQLVYIPVSDKLKKAAEQLGDYLHYMKQLRHDDDKWWEETREKLESVYRELRHVNMGTLMGAPLFQPTTNEVYIETEGGTADAEFQQVLALFQRAYSGKELLDMQIRYESIEDVTR